MARSLRNKARVMILLGSLMLLTLGAIPTGADPEAEERPPGVACPGFQRIDGMGPACPVGNGLWEVFASNGTSLGFTHGPDPAPAGPASDEPVTAATGAVQPPVCVNDPATEYHAVVIYARAFNDADRYATVAAQLRDEILKANTHLRIDAGTFNVQADYKMRCLNGTLEIRNEVLPTSRASADFSTIVNDLRNKGYDDQRVKHWVFYDDTSACTCGGMGHVYGDDRLIADNYNNGFSGAIPMFGITFGHMDYTIMMHENGHNLGAVQLSAARSTGAWHCTDGRDIMCYNDGGSRGSQYTTSVCSGRQVFDCNHNDYFHPAAPAGSYLASKWNIGSTLNRYITYGPCGLAREGPITAPGAGLYLSGLTGRLEANVAPECWGRAFVLQSTFSTGDFDVCFYNGAIQLSCHTQNGDETGIIPPGTNAARITLFSGALEQYTLITP